MGKNYLIYSYEMGNMVYVGLTKNIERRHKEHMSSKKDTLYCFCMKNDINLPEPTILETNLTSLESQSKEKNWLDYYKFNGYELINRAECGIYKSSMGGEKNCINETYKPIKVKNKKTITYEECLELAKKYQYKKDFLTNEGFAYRYAKKMGWFTSFTWLKNSPPIKREKKDITYEDYVNERKKYSTKTEFSKQAKAYYQYGLKHGYNDDFFKKDVTVNVPEKYKNKTFDDVKSELLNYPTKKDLYIKNKGLYSLCRLNGWLKTYYTKHSKKTLDTSNEKMESFDIKSSLLEKCYQCKTYPSYYLDIENCIFYKKMKTVMHIIKPNINNFGILEYNLYINNKKITKPYHIFLGEFCNKDFNNVLYKDGNYNNIDISNLVFEKIDTSRFKQIPGYPYFLLSEKGDIYSTKHFTCFKYTSLKNGEYYCYGYKLDKLVYSLFKENIMESKGTLVHLDGDILNNSIDNLEFTYNLKSINDILTIDNKNGYSFSIKVDNTLLHICTLSDKKTALRLYEDLKSHIKENTYVKQWIYDYIENIIPLYQNENNERNTIKQRTLSSGCYWWESRKKWKSKIYYNNKEYSLGYFDDFESGKLLYEIAILYIQHNKFEKWYDIIKKEKEIINTIF